MTRTPASPTTGRGRPGDGSWTVDGDPRHLRRAAEGSAARLGGAAIGLYQLHKPDPAVPFADWARAGRPVSATPRRRPDSPCRRRSRPRCTCDARLGQPLCAGCGQRGAVVRAAGPRPRCNVTSGWA